MGFWNVVGTIAKAVTEAAFDQTATITARNAHDRNLSAEKDKSIEKEQKLCVQPKSSYMMRPAQGICLFLRSRQMMRVKNNTFNFEVAEEALKWQE